MKEKFARFMMGRYGVDQFSRAILMFTLVLIVVSLFFRTPVAGTIFNVVILFLLIYNYVRMFSRNHEKRYAENQAYLRIVWKVKGFFQKEASHMKQRKTHHIYTCPDCRQKIRIPRGRGKICITCPKCGKEFIKKS